MTLESAEVDEQVWKVNVEVAYPGGGPAFESYRQGLFNNRLWLQKADGSRFEHNGGFSNTASDGGKLGFEYLFVDAPGKPADYQFVYETPSKVRDHPPRVRVQGRAAAVTAGPADDASRDPRDPAPRTGAGIASPTRRPCHPLLPPGEGAPKGRMRGSAPRSTSRPRTWLMSGAGDPHPAVPATFSRGRREERTGLSRWRHAMREQTAPYRSA